MPCSAPGVEIWIKMEGLEVGIFSIETSSSSYNLYTALRYVRFHLNTQAIRLRRAEPIATFPEMVAGCAPIVHRRSRRKPWYLVQNHVYDSRAARHMAALRVLRAADVHAAAVRPARLIARLPPSPRAHGAGALSRDHRASIRVGHVAKPSDGIPDEPGCARRPQRLRLRRQLSALPRRGIRRA